MVVFKTLDHEAKNRALPFNAAMSLTEFNYVSCTCHNCTYERSSCLSIHNLASRQIRAPTKDE